MDPSAQSYFQYYAAQHGGSIPVFRGSHPYQEGAGLGGLLRGLFRAVAPVAIRSFRIAAPIALKGLSSFATNTMRARNEGASFADAAKAAVGPALAAGLDAAMSRAAQGGSGKRGRKRKFQVGVGAALSALAAAQSAAAAKRRGYQPLAERPPPKRSGAARVKQQKGGRAAAASGYKSRRTGQKGTGKKRKSSSSISRTLANF